MSDFLTNLLYLSLSVSQTLKYLNLKVIVSGSLSNEQTDKRTFEIFKTGDQFLFQISKHILP